MVSCDALPFGDKKMQKFLHKLKNNYTVAKTGKIIYFGALTLEYSSGKGNFLIL